ncbi:hypothetical protein NL459_27385, partial [Klebsiella pneumoniae]|nr:hypothetical protein [Klebsiella pneumoniae]
MSYEQGNHLTLSAMHTTLHLGAHADASNHYHVSGAGIETRDLAAYLGPVQVCSVSLAPGARILPEHLPEIRARRVLFRTRSFE